MPASSRLKSSHITVLLHEACSSQPESRGQESEVGLRKLRLVWSYAAVLRVHLLTLWQAVCDITLSLAV